jgi:hypothetical protein
LAAGAAWAGAGKLAMMMLATKINPTADNTNFFLISGTSLEI